jgi:branched-subunit amino acid aminotransferase/4-amino-4-deoxychorismate lyase
MSPSFVLRNGVMIPAAEAGISVFNPAIYGSYGVYESMQVAGGVVFEQEAHLRRLAYSAQVIELAFPASLATIAAWIARVVAGQGEQDCTIRLFVVGPDNGGEPTAFIWAQPPAAYPPTCYTDGANAITFEARRFLPQAKSLNMLASNLAQRRARAAGVHEAFLHHDGVLTEGSNSNLFAVWNDIVLTAPDEEVLAGVTRDVLLALARGAGIHVREMLLPLDEIGGWDECFITSTSRHVMPVTRIDGQIVGDGKVGPLTKRLRDLFEAYFAGQVQRRVLRGRD